MMKVGDRVAVLDENLEGVIKIIDGKQITIDTEDGFPMTFSKSELVVMSTGKDDLVKKASVRQSDVSQKLERTKKQSSTIKPKDRNKPTFEVDLHIHKLTNSEKGMTAHQKLNLQIDTAKRQLDFAISKRIQKMVFIHGKGEGVLKAELETILRRYDQIKFYDADFKTYGFGATEVYIFQNY